MLAERARRGELNPQTWPPVVDADAFEVVAGGRAAWATRCAAPASAAPDDVTVDDLD